MARILLPNQNGIASGSPTPPPSGSTAPGPGDTGFNFSAIPTIGAVIDPSSAINSSPTPIPAITPAPPTAPTGVKATAGNQAAPVTWNAPASNGGLEITTYTVTSNPGGKTCSAATGIHHCTVSHLTNGVSYTFTVTATNPIGTSPPSAPSNAVVPSAAPPPPTAPPITPVAAFSCSATGTLHEESFLDASTDAVAWSWDFGDGATYTTDGAPPPHPYSNAGPWTVTLTVTSASALTDSISHSCAPLGDPAVPSFTCSPGATNFVDFTDGSTGMISSGTWSWGDSTTSPWAGGPISHDYGASPLPSYHVTLTLAGPDGSSAPDAKDCAPGA